MIILSNHSSMASAIYNNVNISGTLNVGQNCFLDVDMSTYEMFFNNLSVVSEIVSQQFTDNFLTIDNNEIQNLNALASTGTGTVALRQQVVEITENGQVIAAITPPVEIIVSTLLLFERANISRANIARQVNNIIKKPAVTTSKTVPRACTMLIPSAPRASAPGSFLINPRSLTISSGIVRNQYAQRCTSSKVASLSIQGGGLGVGKDIYVGANSIDMAYNGTVVSVISEDPLISGEMTFLTNGDILLEGGGIIMADATFGIECTTTPACIVSAPTLTANTAVTTNNAASVSMTIFNGDLKLSGNSWLRSNTIASNDDPYDSILSSFSDTSSYSVSDVDWNSIIYGYDKFIMTSTSSPYAVYLSENAWTSTNLAHGARGIAYSNYLNQYVAVGTSVISKSTNGIAWTAVATPVVGTVNCVAWSPDLLFYLAMGVNVAGYSTDGNIWTTEATPSKTWNGVCWSSRLAKFAICGNNYMGYTTNQLFDSSVAVTGIWNSICWSQKLAKFIAVGNGSVRAVSTNGTSYTTASMGIPVADWNGVIYNEALQLFVATGTTGVAYSADGDTWTLAYSGTGNSIAYGDGVFRVACSLNSLASTTLLTQENVIIGTAGVSNTAINSASLTFNGYQIYSGTDSYSITTTANTRVIPTVSRMKIGNLTYVSVLMSSPTQISPLTTTFPTMDVVLTMQYGDPTELNVGDSVPFMISQPSAARYYCEIVYTGTLEFTMTFVNDVVAPASYNVIFWYTDYS